MNGKRKVLFVERKLRNEKLGIMYLASALKSKGHHADLIQIDKESLHERILDYRPDFVAFSIATGEHTYALQTAREVKKRYGLPNIFGGPHCTFFPEFSFESDVDFLVSGQGEKVICDIVEGRVKPGFVKGIIADHPDELPFPDRDIFYQYKEFRDNPMKNVITSRACPYRCSYCFNHSYLELTKINGETRKWFRRRSAKSVVREISEIRDRYPLKQILFIDDNFLQGGKSWINDFLKQYSEKVRLPWMCSFRVNHLNDELGERLFNSGLAMVNYALESADPEIQQRLLNRGHINNGDIIHAISLFNRFGIRARMQNMIGLPLSNPLEDALNTLRFNIQHRVADSWCSIFQPYPRTALGQYCVDHGFISDCGPDCCSESFFLESPLNIPNKNELYALQKLWYFIVEGRIPLNLTQILIRGEFTPQIGEQLQDLRFRCSRKKLYGIDDADPKTVVDLKSRERWNPSTSLKAGEISKSAFLIRMIFKDANLPDGFIEILSQVDFADQERDHLFRYHNGEKVYDPPTYTLDNRTGELKDQNISIYRHGCIDPDTSDIRMMPEQHFMRGINQSQEIPDFKQTMRGEVFL